MGNEYGVSVRLRDGCEPSERQRGEHRPEELSENKRQYVLWTDPRERIGERARDGDRRISK